MKGIKLWSIASLGSLLALLSNAYLGSLPVSAATVFDGLINPSNTLVVTDIETGGNQKEITLAWTGIMHDKCESAYNSYQAALTDTNGRWAIVQNTASGDAYKSILIGWSTNSAHTTVFSEVGPQIYVQTQHQVEIFLYNDEFYCNSSTNPGLSIGGTSPDRTKIFLSTYPSVYPDGYEGEVIPSSYDPFGDYLEYKIIDKLGTFTIKNIDTSRINKCELFIDENPNIEPDDGEVSEAQYTVNDCASPVTHQWSQYGTYYVRLELTKSSNGEIREYTQTFTVDGRTYDGSFNDQGNYDNTTINYEDCTTYGVDLIGGFTCIMSNFGKWLQATIISLFVPTGQFFQNYFNKFSGLITEKLGFLVWPLQFAINFIQAFFDGLSGTLNICNWSFGNIFGNTFRLNFCSFEQSFPTPFNTAKYIIQAFTVFALVSGLYAKYRRIMQT